MLSGSTPSSMSVMNLFIFNSFLNRASKIMDWIHSSMFTFVNLPSKIKQIYTKYALVFLPGIVVGRLFDIGYFRSIFLTSSALLVAATFLIAQCTEYWQFLLCQGLAVGVRTSYISRVLQNSLISKPFTSWRVVGSLDLQQRS